MCNDIKIVWLGCEKHRQNQSKNGQKTVFFSIFFPNFLKNCPYDSNEIFYSHSTPYYEPLCAILSILYGWNVRNIAKINPKMARKRRFPTFFYFVKNSLYDSNEILYSHPTPYYGPLCVISSILYGWDVRNIAKISPKMAKKQPFCDFFRFSQKLSIRFEQNFLQSFCTP